jgi:amino acid permease
METKQLIKLSAIAFMMVGVLILTVPLTTQVFTLMNTSNTVLNFIGVFIYLLTWLGVAITEYSLYKEFKKNLGVDEPTKTEETKQENQESNQ